MLTLILLVIKTGCFLNNNNPCWLSSSTKTFNKLRVTRKSIVLEFKIACKCKTNQLPGLYRGILAQGCTTMGMTLCQYPLVPLKKAR